jgi:hypothetical protein
VYGMKSEEVYGGSTQVKKQANIIPIHSKRSLVSIVRQSGEVRNTKLSNVKSIDNGNSAVHLFSGRNRQHNATEGVKIGSDEQAKRDNRLTGLVTTSFTHDDYTSLMQKTKVHSQMSLLSGTFAAETPERS